MIMRKLSSALEGVADAVFITNRDGRIEFVNASFEAVTGYSRMANPFVHMESQPGSWQAKDLIPGCSTGSLKKFPHPAATCSPWIVEPRSRGLRQRRGRIGNQ